MKAKSSHHSKLQTNNASTKNLLQLSLLANVFEFYEFSVYGFLSATIGKLFFEAAHPTMELIKAFMSLALGHIARPLGSIYFGTRGDSLGRRSALLLSLTLMTITTVLIGLLPTYDQIGILATISLMLLRIIQGFAIGGEPTTACYIFENTDNMKYKSILCSAVSVSPTIGIFLGSFVTYWLTSYLSQDQLLVWGWRIPFLLGIPLSLFIAYARHSIEETALFNQRGDKTAKGDLLFYIPLIKACCIFGFLNVAFYVLKVWMPFYLHHFLKVPLHTANLTNTITLCALMGLYLLCGYCSKRWGYRKLLLASIIGTLLFAIPLFKGLQGATSFGVLLGIQLMLALLVSSSNSVYVEVVGNLFSTKNRCLGTNLSCTLPAALIGGTTPLVCTYVIHKTGWLMFPAFYLMFFGLLALPVAASLTKHSSEKL